MEQLNRELLKLLSLGDENQNSIIRRFDDLAKKYGTLNLEKWRNLSNNKNSLLHELVEKKLDDVIRHVLTECQFDVNVRRTSDGLTPLQVASANKDRFMCDLLKQFGATEIQTEDVSTWLSDADKGKSMNIVWIDLEMTSIEEPEILECAVIITDKDLRELDRDNWVIHFNQSVLDGLGQWHQDTFANREKGGNDLFADVLKSRLKKEQVEEELLAKLKIHCPAKMCPLAGSSIHIDKQVLQLRMPKVHDYLHYRIIDVSSFQAVMRRWAPWIEADIKKQLAKKGQETVNHRAMDDIEWSIAFMREFQTFLTKQNSMNNRKNESQINGRRKRSVSPSIVERSYPVARNQQADHRNQQADHRNQQADHRNQQADHRNQQAYNRNQQAYNRNQQADNRNQQGYNRNQQADNRNQLYGDEKRLLERLDHEKNFNYDLNIMIMNYNDS
ncbi:unnamed protein product [Rotaria sordida]|uniref:Exonuclease domain-containing protein n=1 Tax=Rotaria sordida TaxID=392033 RepID=A0A814LL55_9BILA|nr:unnamed protein product [Rotaria sordida]